MLILYPATLPKEFIISNSFGRILGSFIGIGSYRLQIGIIWLFPSLFESPLFLAFVLLLRLESLKLY
jgi:hypothetical protein